MGAKLQGYQKAAKSLNDALSKIVSASYEGAVDAALHIAAEAVKRTPVDTGNLRGSLSVQTTTGTAAKGTKEGSLQITGAPPRPKRIKIRIGYSASYAHKQHEDVAAKHPQGGEPKFLENAVKENANRIVEYMKRKAQEKVR
jgi:hypothetical protein